MKKRNKSTHDFSTLRQKAEDLIKLKRSETGVQFTDIDMLKTFQELEVYHIELELQNEELNKAKENAEIVSEKYSKLYDYAPIGYFTLSEFGQIIELNLSGAQMLGKVQANLINSSFGFFLSNESRPIFNQFLKNALKSNTRECCELTLKLHDKPEMIVYLTGTVIEKNQQCLVAMVDITDRKMAKDAFRKNEKLHHNIILQTAMDGFLSVDFQGNILEANETYSQMSGYSMQELIIMQLSDLEVNESSLKINEHIEKVIQQGGDRFETRHRRKDGSIFDVEINVQFQPQEGRRFVAFIHDITGRKRHEEDLDYHAGLVENVSDAIISTDVDFRVKSWNMSAEKLYGWKSSETIGKEVSGIVQTTYLTNTSREEAIRLLQTDGIWQGEVIQKRKDNTSVNIQASVKILKDRKGKIIGSVSVNRDITEMRKSEVILRQRENQYRSFFLNNNAVILIVDPETTEIKNANPAACRYYGWSHAELCNKSIFDINLTSKDETFFNLQKTKKQKNNHLLLKHRLANGELRDVEVYSGPVQLGESVMVYEIIYDITEKKKANELLIESEQRYRSLFEESNDAIFLVDLQSGRYIDCNRLAERLTGYSREEILSLNTGALLPAHREKEVASNIEFIVSNNLLRKETEILTRNGKIIPVEFNSSLINIDKKQYILSILHDISDRRAAEEALKQSEERVKFKLQSILSPAGSIADLELNDIIDAESLQKLLNNFYELAGIPIAIIDINGKILVGVGWQNICIKFHRVHPETCRNCIESDLHLTQGIPAGEFRLYKCNNSMWDMATPLIVGGEHKGNLFMGQFFLDDEKIDFEQFRKQANHYGFEEKEYLEALMQVPRINKQKLEYAKAFFLNLSQTITQLSYSNIKLARSISQQMKVEDALRESEEFMKKAQEIGHLGSWSLDLNTNHLAWSDEMYHMFGIQQQMFEATYEGFLDSVHPEDRDAVNSAYTNSIKEGKDSYEIEHRIFRKDTGELRFVFEKCEHIRDISGKIIRSMGMTHDITDRKLSEKALRENERLLRESQAAANIGSYSADLINNTWNASPEIYEIFGISETYEHTLEAWIKVIHPDFKMHILKHFQELGFNRKRFDHEYKIIRVSDGMERWVHGLGEPEYDAEMKPVRLIGTIQDITNRKQSEEELKLLYTELESRVIERTADLIRINASLKETEEKYRTVADYTYDWEYWISATGNIEYMSPSVKRVTGYSIKEFTDNPRLRDQIIHKEDQKLWKNHIKNSLISNPHENLKELECRIVTKGGEIRWIGHVCRKIYSEGKYLGIRVSNRDITEKVKAESELLNVTIEVEERERNYISRELHDGLGPLLSTIKLYFQWLAETDNEKKIKIITRKGNQSIDRAIQTTREISHGLSSLFLNAFGYADAIIRFIQNINEAQKIVIDFIPNSKERFNNLLEITLYRITTELINNTLNYADATHIVINFNIHKEIETISLIYADDGKGFEIAKIEKAGKGIGLMNIRQRIKILRGTIKIESGIGEGLRVEIELPLNN